MKTESIESDQEWNAKNDARTLIEAEAIKNDKTKYKKALVAAKKLVKEKQAEAKAAQKVVGKKEMSLMGEDED